MSTIPVRSVEEALRSAHRWGGFARTIAIRDTAATTAGTTASGSMSGRRMTATVPIPAMTGPTGCYCTMARVSAMPAITIPIIAAETELGSLAVATDTFTAGTAMRTRRDKWGRTVQADAQLVAIVATAALTATTPTITITYTNQDGTPNRTATVILPTSIAVNTAYLIRPDQLQAGDLAIRSVENMSKSAGTAGTLKLYGLTPLGIDPHSGLLTGGMNSPTQIPSEHLELYAGDDVAFYAFGLNNASMLHAQLNFLGSD